MSEHRMVPVDHIPAHHRWWLPASVGMQEAWIDGGRIVYERPTDDVVADYHHVLITDHPDAAT